VNQQQDIVTIPSSKLTGLAGLQIDCYVQLSLSGLDPDDAHLIPWSPISKQTKQNDFVSAAVPIHEGPLKHLKPARTARNTLSLRIGIQFSSLTTSKIAKSKTLTVRNEFFQGLRGVYRMGRAMTLSYS
jgi:hypothetical protein